MRLIISLLLVALPVTGQARKKPIIGSENAVARHLEDGEEYRIPLLELLEHGRLLFSANWTPEEGGLRPLMKGNGRRLELHRPALARCPLLQPRLRSRRQFLCRLS